MKMNVEKRTGCRQLRRKICPDKDCRLWCPLEAHAGIGGKLLAEELELEVTALVGIC